MENFNLELLSLAFLGMFIHILMKIDERKNKENSKFSLKVFLSNGMNWVRILLSISSIIALIMMSNNLSSIMGVTLSDGSPAVDVFAFGAGYLNHSIIRNVLKIFKRGEFKDEN